jgi:prepilin-type N-terminal cleavage/methylation domain-containing protein
MKNNTKNRGFTLVELLIVITVILVLFAAIYFALNPAQRFRDSRNSRRSSDINAILSAIKVNQVDSKGAYPAAVNVLTAGNVYMIGTATNACNATCLTAVTSPTSCVDLSVLTTGGYLTSVPISPNGIGTWNAAVTGYTISKATNGIITVRACEAENTSEIMNSR